MLTYDELTSAQQLVIDRAMQTLRPLAGEFARLLVRIDAHGLSDASAQFRQLLATLDQNSVVPNTTDLHGAAPMPVARVISLLDVATQLSLTHGTIRRDLINAAGAANCV